MPETSPTEVSPLSIKQLLAISFTTFLIGFLLLELVDPRWIGAFRSIPKVASIIGAAPAAVPTARPVGQPRRSDRLQPARRPSPAAASSPGEVARVDPGDDLVVRGRSVIVTDTDGQGAFLRAQPADDGGTLALIQENEVVVLTGQETEVGDRLWVEVRDRDGKQGWMAADFLAPAPADRSP